MTSTAEVEIPGIFYFLDVCIDDSVRLRDLTRGQAGRCCKANLRRKPEFSFTVGMCDVNMDARLLTGEEK